MSQIDFSKAPESATHYLSAVRVEDIAWFKVSGSGVRRWYPHEGTEIYVWSSVSMLPPLSEAIPSARRGPDWGKAPEGATHWVVSARERVPTGWYRADGIKMRCIAQEGEYLFRLDDVQHADSGLTLIERPATEPAPFSPDWANAPEDATHHTRDKCEAPWRKVVGGDVFMWHRGAWELIGMPAGLGEYVPRPAVEFVPRDFSGEVRDYGPSSIVPVGLAEWGGSRIPPIGVDCLVTPHNTQWGFDNLDTRRVKVLGGYGGEFVWLMELHSDGSDSFVFFTARSDKVDFEPYRTPEQVASDNRIEAAQVWLKDIEQQYGQEAADKCEDILMDFEKRKKAGAQP